MNNEQGREWYGIGIDDSELDRAVKSVDKKFKEISSAAEKEGQRMDKAFSKAATGVSGANKTAKQELADTIAFQKKIIAELEARLVPLENKFNRLNTATSNPAMLQARQKASAAFKELRAELQGEKQALADLEKQQQGYTTKSYQLRTELMNLRDEMAKLKMAGKQESAQYKDLQAKLERLGTAYREVEKEQKALTTGGSQMAGVLSGFSALTGAMSAYVGIAGLAGDRSEDLVKIQTKLQSLIAVTIGLQQIANTLHTTSAFRITTVAKAKDLWAAANLKVATTLGITNVQAQILTATLTLGLSVAITAIAAGLSAFVSRARAAAKEQREMNKAVSESVAKSIAEYTRLKLAYESLGDSLADKKKFVDKNKKAFEDLGVSISSAGDAEKLFREGTQGFKEAMMERAKAAASFDFAVEKYKGAFQKELEAQELPDTKTKYVVDPETGMRLSSYEVANKKKEGAMADAKSAMEQAEQLINKSIAYSRNASRLLNDLGLSESSDIVNGTKAYWEEQRTAAMETLESLKDVDKGSKAWKDAVEKYNNATEKLKIWDLSTKDKGNPLQQLMERATASQLSLTKARLDLMAEGREKELEEIRLGTRLKVEEINKEERELAKAYKDAGKSMPADQRQAFEARRGLAEQAGQQAEQGVNVKYYGELAERERELSQVFLSENEKRQQSIKERYEAERKWANEMYGTGGMTKDQYNSFVNLIDSAQTEEALSSFREKYKSVADQITEIEKQAAADRLLANTDAQRVMIDEWEKSQKSKLVSQNLLGDDSFGTLLGDLDRTGTNKLSGALSKAKGQLKSAMDDGKLEPADFKTLTDAIERAEQEVRERNPFKALATAIKEYKKQPKGEKDITDIARSAAAGFSIVQGSLSAVVGGLNKMGMAGDQETQELMGSFVELAGSAAELAEGIASKNPVMIIKGTIGVVTSLFDIFDRRSRDAQREMRRHEEAIKGLQKAYRSLEQQIKTAFSTDYFRKQVDQARNLEQQIQRTYAMIAAEESKRKRKRDKEKIEAWKDEIEDLRNQAADIRRSVIDELMTTDLRSFSSQLASSVIQGYTEGMEDMGSVVQNSMDELMRNMITKQFDTLLAQKLLQPMFAEMEKAIDVDRGDFTYDPQELERIRQTGAVAKTSLVTAGESYRQMLEDLGLMDANAQRQAAKKGIAQASQESIDDLSGRVTNIQSHTYSISNDFKNLLSDTNMIVQHMMNIDNNTRRLEGIERDMGAVKSGIDEINLKGVQIR